MRKYPWMWVVPSGTWNKTGTWEHSKDDRVPDEAQGGKRKMIKILIPGTLKRIKCGALLQYDEEDVKEENTREKFPSEFSRKWK